jgi:hypothetical protein
MLIFEFTFVSILHITSYPSGIRFDSSFIISQTMMCKLNRYRRNILKLQC